MSDNSESCYHNRLFSFSNLKISQVWAVRRGSINIVNDASTNNPPEENPHDPLVFYNIVEAELSYICI